MSEEVTRKTCGKCRQAKAFSEFYRMAVGVHGLDGYCKECRKDKNREYNQKSRERKTEYMRQYRVAKKEGQLEDFLKTLERGK